MRKLGLVLVLAAIGVGAAIGSAEAASVPPSQLGVAAHSLNIVEQTQYVYGGRRYCWYGNGWNGPGWYWCGYPWRRGYGWGGVRGWNNWAWGGWGPHPYYSHRYWRGGRWYYR